MFGVNDTALDWLSAVRRELDASVLEPVVRNVLRRPGATVSAFDIRPIEYSNVDPDRRLLMRVTGEAVDAGGAAAWSVVLKAFRRPSDAGATVDEPTHYDYWAREPEFFASGLWTDIGPGLRSVRCHGIDRRAPDEVWIWLEALAESNPGHWPSDAFERAAEDLGRFAGSYVAGRPLPTESWLADTRSVQVQYSILRPNMRDPILAALESPPTTSRAAASAFGTTRDRAVLRDAFLQQIELLDAIDRSQRALCHNDTMAPNLFVGFTPSGGPDTKAIDWALVGVGPVGGDLGHLVAGSACFFRAASDALHELDRRTFEAYLAGMADVGAVVDANAIRLASLVTVLAQWSAVVAIHLISALDPAEEWVEGFWDRPRQEVVQQFVPLLAFLTRRAEETLIRASAQA